MKWSFFSLLLFFFLVSENSISQNIYGRWEGISSGGEFLQINLVKDGEGVCGYTFDYDIRIPSSFCRANFKGYFDKERSVWIIMGTSFIQNSGSHVLMYITLQQSNEPSNSLRGLIDTKSAALSMLGVGEGIDRVILRKVALEPAKINGIPYSCPQQKPKPLQPKSPTNIDQPNFIKPMHPPVTKVIPKKIKPQPKVLPKKYAPITKGKIIKPAKPVIAEKPTYQKQKKDTASIVKPNANPQTEPVSSALREMQARKKTEFSRIVVHDRKIALKVYDNGVVDNDSVSIFYNGKLIAAHKKLSEEPFILNLELDENKTTHELIMFAENLGTIPPNTALIVVTTKDNRYELRSSASLTENAVLTFEYRPR